MLVKQEISSAHWYTKKGEPAYTIIGKNGKERATTVKDAREHGYLPSVTTILAQLDKPALTRWKMEQMLLASLTLPRAENESESDWIARVVEDSRSTGKDAMARGTEMHNMLELYFNDVYMIQPPLYTIRTHAMMKEYFGDQNWICEQSFAHGLGYAGKCDLYSGNGLVVDFKTKTDSLDKATVYDEHIMQLAAYREGLLMPTARCAIVFVSEHETKICEIEQNDLKLGFEKFKDLLNYFKKDKKLG